MTSLWQGQWHMMVNNKPRSQKWECIWVGNWYENGYKYGNMNGHGYKNRNENGEKQLYKKRQCREQYGMHPRNISKC